MNNKNIFSIISEINEALSLTNEPEKLVNAAMDTFSQILNVECCWIQTISDTKAHELSLAAERGFNDDMRSEIISMNMNHDFSGQVIGMGHKIIIPDLNNDGVYGLSSFRNAGYRWLVAVPLMTYRVYGILGTASHNRKILRKDTADLVLVIAGLIANALSKVQLSRSFPTRQNPVTLPVPEIKLETPLPDIPDEVALETVYSAPLPDTLHKVTPETTHSPPPPQNKPPKPLDPAFHSHTHKMRSFRKSHH